jgi:hypothetical protein
MILQQLEEFSTLATPSKPVRAKNNMLEYTIKFWQNKNTFSVKVFYSERFVRCYLLSGLFLSKIYEYELKEFFTEYEYKKLMIAAQNTN